MPISKLALHDLGRWADLADRLAAGEVIGERFCVIGEVRDAAGVTVVPVDDLEQTFGDAPTHRLEIHLLAAPATTADRERLDRALSIVSRTQSSVFATANAGTKFVILCEPVVGQSMAELAPSLDRRRLLVLAYELADLLAKLHAANVTGLRFDRRQLRTEDGHVYVDGFAHLSGAERSADADIAALFECLAEFGDTITELLPRPASSRELLEQLRSLINAESVLDDLALPSEPPFVGRELALETITNGFARAQIAQSSAVVVTGERGVGKSRLLREFVAERLKADDAFVLVGTWQARSARIRDGLSGALEQLARSLRTLNADERSEARRRINAATRNLGAVLTRSAPALGGVLRDIEDLPQLELSGAFERHTAVIADVLRSIGTARRPLVLVLDNLENADSGSMGVLKLLTQSHPAHHTLVLAGFRKSDAGSKLPAFESEVVSLAPFTPSEVERLLDTSLPGEVEELPVLAQLLHSASGGTPLAVWANLRVWLDRGLLVREVAGDRWRRRKSLRDEADRQPGVKALFGARLASCSPAARELALSMAVIGVDIEIGELNDAGDQAPAAREAVLRELVEHGIINPTKSGYRFPHDSIRELTLESVDADQQRQAHARAAAAMTKRAAPIATIAYHRELAFDLANATKESSDELARLHAEAGRERLAVYDLERARWHLERALEHSRDEDHRAVAAEGLADVCLLIGDLDTAVSLYTAIIAVAELDHALRSATKAGYFLLFKSALRDGQQLGNMALERVPEPTPGSRLGKLLTILRSLAASWFRKPPHDVQIREALTALYTPLIVIGLTADPLAMFMHLIRARWISRGLRVGAVASILSFEASIRASLGHYRAADALFSKAERIAREARDPWAIGVVLHTWGHNALLPSDRYEDGQDRLDDAIASFRETGDVSIATVSLLWKALYGRDREPTNTTLGWIDEAISMARRNGKELMRTSLEAARLAVLARQGRTDLAEKIRRVSTEIASLNLSDLDRITAYGQLAFAALDTGESDLALEQIIAGQHLVEKQSPLPDFCRDIHVATLFVILERHQPNRRVRALRRRSLRALKRAAKLAPRLRVMLDFYELKHALAAGSTRKAIAVATTLVNNFEQHGNMYAAREAHRAIAQSLRADNVLAATEHERFARKFGQRLGLDERVLLDDIGDVLDDELLHASSFTHEDAHYDIPAAGMLTVSVAQRKPSGKPAHYPDDFTDDQTEALAAWSLADVEADTELRDILAPVRDTIQVSVPGATLEVTTKQPNARVPIPSSDLQVLLLNLVLTSRDAIGSNCEINLDLNIEDETPESSHGLLVIRLQTIGQGASTPVLSAFATCEDLVRRLGGKLSASTERGAVVLHARIPLKTPTNRAERPALGTILVVHADPEIRGSIAGALVRLGARAVELEPDDFDMSQLEVVSVLFADAHTLGELDALAPLLNARLVEIARSSDSVDTSRTTLRHPFELSELEAILR
jgi:hypothetical protein